MATIKVYRSPPGWPPPPLGWTPPPGWQPDPSWGPAPEGWSFWDEQRANPRAWAYTFVASTTVALAFFALGAFLAASEPTALVLGIFVGRGLVVGVLVGTIGHLSTRRWPEWAYLVVALVVYVVIAVLGTIGRLNRTG